MDQTIGFIKCGSEATIPSKGSAKAAGMDLSSSIDCIIMPGETVKVPTGLKVKLPENHYGQIASRSGLASRQIVVEGGVIDEDYTGELIVMVHNQRPRPSLFTILLVCISALLGYDKSNLFNSFVVKKGDRIAQLICLPYSSPAIVVMDEASLVQTTRGGNGFGSTGA